MKISTLDKRTQKGYGDKTKYQAVILFNQVGSLRAVADSLGVRYDTMRVWHTQDWWKDIEDDLKSQKKHKLSGQLVKLKDKAIEVVEDRLVNGDFYYDQKKGEMIRKPINADSAANIMRTSLDKHLQMEEMALLEKKVATEEKITDRLAKLGEDFKRFAKAKEITNDAIHDQREAGLQEGTSLGEEDNGKGPARGQIGSELGSSGGGEEVGSQTPDEYGSGSQEGTLEGGIELQREPASGQGHQERLILEELERRDAFGDV
jgi:hypothetical protein